MATEPSAGEREGAPLAKEPPAAHPRHARRLGLQARLFGITALVLGTCFGVVAWLLDQAYRQTVILGAEAQLLAVARGVLGAAEERDGAILEFPYLGEQRLSDPDSGLYAFVDSPGAGTVWRSPSVAVGASGIAEVPSLMRRPAPGEGFFDEVASREAERFVYAYTVIWAGLNDVELTVWVLADQEPYRSQVAAFRGDIATWLGIAAAVFVGIQFAALHWGLLPVRRMAARLAGLESGARRSIGDDYPPELLGLARNLSRFIGQERANRERYRRAMDDLAHSLKTPLAVLKNAVRHGPQSSPRDGMLREQIERMETTVGHQLSRAAAAPAVLPLVRVAVAPTVERIVGAVARAYPDKPVAAEVVTASANMTAAARVRVDERDLMEMLGNLVENAFKYTRSRVRVSVSAPIDATVVAVRVEDDGPGIQAAERDSVLQRGTRGDTATTGQGIGLAIVVELATAYEGRVTVEDSALGGANVVLELPA